MVRGQTMVSGSLVSAKNKSSEPELEGNIRKLASANIAAWQAESEDSQMSTGNLGMMLGEVSKASTASTSTVPDALQRLVDSGYSPSLKNPSISPSNP